jgi:predicted AAA+ superfamily ATPase
MYFDRVIEQAVIKSLKLFPVTALTGPRQCGKSTLARYLAKLFPRSVYLDLERPSDLRKIEDPEWFFTSQKRNLICIDEVQLWGSTQNRNSKGRRDIAVSLYPIKN